MAWSISRRWLVTSGPECTAATLELAQHNSVCLLGAAGLGKSWELESLAEFEQHLGRHIAFIPLGRAASSGLTLRQTLNEKTAAANAGSSIYLDGLDEAMIPINQAAGVIEDWITSDCPVDVKLRIACRSAVWPGIVARAVSQRCDDSITAELLPFNEGDIEEILHIEELNAGECIKAIKDCGIFVLAQQPLTLQLIIEEFKSKEQLPRSRFELFERSVMRLCQESTERQERGTAPAFPPHELLEAAERLAVYSVTSGREMIDLSDTPTAGLPALSHLELAQLPSGDGRPLDDSFLRALANTGLFVGDGERRFRFLHRQFAEYLAGRRLAKLPFHQARTLLARDSGWTTGIAGPLRETAAVAASHDESLANWIAKYDPEVIGLSDIAESSVRKQALSGLLQLFRQHKLTDAHVTRDDISLSGLRYEGVENDLQPILQERGNGLIDVHACAIRLAASWGLDKLAREIADIMLDDGLPFDTRSDAGYALCQLEAPEEKRRLLSLVCKVKNEEEQELLGLALQSNWPGNITTRQLLDVLDPPIDGSFYGSYQGFLYKLEREGFGASDNSREGLEWAMRMLETDGSFSRTNAIAAQILAEAIQCHDDSTIELVAEYLLKLQEQHVELFRTSNDDHENSVRDRLRTILSSNNEVRRSLIERLVQKSTNDRVAVQYAVRSVPGLMQTADFQWLVALAVDGSHDNLDRNRTFAELAFWLPWRESTELIDIWIQHSDFEPIASVFGIPKQVDLDSEYANEARSNYARMKEAEEKAAEQPQRLSPPPHERIRLLLDRSQGDPRWFSALANTLTLTETSTAYDFERFLVETPGWQSAAETLQAEIIAAARAFIVSSDNAITPRSRVSKNTILGDGVLAAMFLLMQTDSTWLNERSADWWEAWSWHILRELHIDLVGESNEPKKQLLQMLHANAPLAVQKHLVKIAGRSGDGRLLQTLLSQLADLSDPSLDDAMCKCIEQRRTHGESLGHVAGFVLTRDALKSLPLCIDRLARNSHSQPTVPAVRIGVQLLTKRPAEAWHDLVAFFSVRPDLARHIVAEFAHDNRERGKTLDDMGSTRVGELLSLMLNLFPPSDDPKEEGAHWVSHTDSAIMLRKELFRWLAAKKEEAAVSALQRIEAEFSERYPWIRRARATAERDFHLSHWQPLDSARVARVLSDAEMRLLRSGQDVIDGILAALHTYNDELRTGLPSKIDELWNDAHPTANDATLIPSPKSEEHASDKICEAIRSQFAQFGIAANREVQIRRRQVSAALGGASGSEVDVLVEIPGGSSTNGSRIIVVIEVKRSCNAEAQTGLRDQLVNRYMVEAGTAFGVFVVVYFDAPGGLRAHHRPQWDSPHSARSDLETQAADAMGKSAGSYNIGSFVVDAQRM